MDFPKFDWVASRIWLDGCASYFALYDIRWFQSDFAMPHMIGDAAYWFHSYKLEHEWSNWETFKKVVLHSLI
jgi:hypothetical protein